MNHDTLVERVKLLLLGFRRDLGVARQEEDVATDDHGLFRSLGDAWADFSKLDPGHPRAVGLAKRLVRAHEVATGVATQKESTPPQDGPDEA